MTRAEPFAAERASEEIGTTPPSRHQLLREYAAPIALAAVMLGLGLFRLSAKSLWQDEAFTWSSATLSNGRFIDHLLNTGATGGLYLVLQHVWVQLGTGVWWLRLPSVVFATAAVPVLWVLTRRLCDARTATFATALLVVNGMFLNHVQEARTYPLVVLLACTSMYWFVREMESPGPRPRVWWAVTTILLVLAHVVAGLVFLAQLASLVVARPDRERTRHVLVGALMISVVVVPFGLLAASQPLQGPVAHPSVRFFYNTVRVLSGGGNLLLALEAVAATAAVVLVIRVFRVAGRSDTTWLLALPLFWFGFSSATFFLYSQVTSGFQQRYLLAFVPGLFILVATGITQIPSRGLQVVAILLVLALAARGVWNWYEGEPREGWNVTASVLERDHRPGDVIVFDVDLSRIPVAYYLRDQPQTRRDITPVWPGDLPWVSGFQTGDYRFKTIPPVLMARIAAAHGRIWVVDAGTLGAKTNRALRVLRRTHRRKLDVQVDGAPSLQLYVPR